MPIDPETAAVAVVSAVGAAGVAAVTLRHYEPPPREGEEEAPEPVMEAGMFFVLAGVLFTLVGFALVYVAEWGGLVGRAATLLLTPLGFYVAYSIREGDVAAADEATEQLGFVSATALGAFPVVLLAVSAV